MSGSASTEWSLPLTLSVNRWVMAGSLPELVMRRWLTACRPVAGTPRARRFLASHDLVRKPVPTFRDHACPALADQRLVPHSGLGNAPGDKNDVKIAGNRRLTHDRKRRSCAKGAGLIREEPHMTTATHLTLPT